MFKAQDGRVLIGFGETRHLIALDLLVPRSLRGLSYDEIKTSTSIAQYFDLADLVLISYDAMQAHMRSLDMTGVTKHAPLKTKLPAVDLDHLRLRDDEGRLDPLRLQDIFGVVTAYWDGEGRLAIEPGLVAALWRRGMSGADIIRCMRASTGKDGKLIKAAGRGHDIMTLVIDAYLAVTGLPRDTEVSQADMGVLVEQWLTATRSTAMGTKEAANTVLHWGDYRRLGLVDAGGNAVPENTRRLAEHVFTKEGITFDALALWADQNFAEPIGRTSGANSAARSMLKKKRQKGKLNRKRGRR